MQRDIRLYEAAISPVPPGHEFEPWLRSGNRTEPSATRQPRVASSFETVKLPTALSRQIRYPLPQSGHRRNARPLGLSATRDVPGYHGSWPVQIAPLPVCLLSEIVTRESAELALSEYEQSLQPQSPVPRRSQQLIPRPLPSFRGTALQQVLLQNPPEVLPPLRFRRRSESDLRLRPTTSLWTRSRCLTPKIPQRHSRDRRSRSVFARHAGSQPISPQSPALSGLWSLLTRNRVASVRRLAAPLQAPLAQRPFADWMTDHEFHEHSHTGQTRTNR